MKKTMLALIAVGAVALLAMIPAKEIEKIYYKDVKIETSEATIEIQNAVSTDKETKFKLKITNKTGDYLVFKPEETSFIINGKEFKPAEKNLFIQPNGSGSRVINLKGTYNTLKNYSFNVSGLYKASADGKALTAPDFKLPAVQNEFKTGGFTCSMIKLKKESDETKVKFSCAYNGDKIGIFNPRKVTVKMPTGTEHANADLKAESLILMKGADDNFSLEWERMPGGKSEDMQKVEMIIMWKDAFSETMLQKLGSQKIEVEMDEALTNEKAK